MKETLGFLVKTLAAVAPDPFGATAAAAYPALRGSYALPLNVDRLPVAVQAGFRQGYELPAVSLWRLRNVYITDTGIIFKNFKVFVPSLADRSLEKQLTYTFLLRQFRPAVQRTADVPAPLLLVHDQWSSNYYHWMIDLLPRLLLGDELKSLPLALPAVEADYMPATLRALVFTNFFKFKADEIVVAREVLLPERTAMGAFQNPQLLPRLRDVLVQALHPVAVPRRRRVYASRTKARKRRLLNEAELLPMLESYGFEFVCFEDLSFRQQIQLMRETDVLVGAHGANLVNILFMQPGARLVELLNQDYLNLVYYRMASALGLPYYFVPGVADAARREHLADRHAAYNDADLTIAPAFFAETLRQLFSSEAPA